MKMTEVLLAILITLPIIGRAQEVLAVETSRPLEEAIKILEAKYGWRIHYEDPPYTDPRDLVDKTHPSYRGSGRAIVPRPARVEIHYSVSPFTGKPDSPLPLLQTLIEDHAKRANPGRFQIKTVGDLYFVVPVAGSVLDAPITLLEKERTYDETLQDILQAVSRASGIPVRGGHGIGRPRFERLKFGASAEPARNVLLRLFESQKGYWFCWDLLYSPNWGYSLTIHGDRIPPTPPPPKRYVMKEVKLPDGTKGVVPVEVP